MSRKAYLSLFVSFILLWMILNEGVQACSGASGSCWTDRDCCGGHSCNEQYCSCFVADTLITMGDGSLKQIREIKEGDEVATPSKAVAKVSLVTSSLFTGTIYGLNNIPPFVTGNHYIPLFKSDSVSTFENAACGAFHSVDKCAKQGFISIGTSLGKCEFYDDKCNMIEEVVHAIPKTNVESITVWDLVLETEHRYIANGITVSDMFIDIHKYKGLMSLFHHLQGSIEELDEKFSSMTNSEQEATSRTISYMLNMIF